MQSRLIPNRMSVERVDDVVLPLLDHYRATNDAALVKTDFVRLRNDYQTLIGFARDGVPIIAAPDFRPNPARGSLSSSHRAAPTAVAAHIHKGCVAGLYAVIDEHTTERYLKERNEISLGVAPKKGKPSARPTCNPSSNASRQPPFLNSPEAVEMARMAWGDIEHPTVIDLVQMLVQAANIYGWDNIVMWKGDLKGAYTLL